MSHDSLNPPNALSLLIGRAGRDACFSSKALFALLSGFRDLRFLCNFHLKYGVAWHHAEVVNPCDTACHLQSISLLGVVLFRVCVCVKCLAWKGDWENDGCIYRS